MKKSMIEFVKRQRSKGVSWTKLADMFNDKFGTDYSHDNIRMRSKGKGVSKLSKSVKNVLIIPDTHVPFHDKRAYSLMLNSTIAHYGKDGIDEVVILGDFADFYCVNSHGKTASLVGLKLKKEVEAVNRELDKIDSLFPSAKKVFIQGNHENRLERYIDKKCPDLFGVVGTEQLFKLNKRNWEFVPYGPDQLYKVAGSKLYARHEPYGGGVHVAHGTVVKAGCSVIFGHVHRVQESQVVMANGDNHRGVCVGWLGDKDNQVFNYVKNHHQWALGWGLASVLPDGTFFLNTVHIINYTCAIGGRVYKG